MTYLYINENEKTPRPPAPKPMSVVKKLKEEYFGLEEICKDYLTEAAFAEAEAYLKDCGESWEYNTHLTISINGIRFEQ